MRISNKKRATKETEIEIKVNIDGNGKYKIDTGIKFFDHMLEQLSSNSKIDMEIGVKSLDTNKHHIVEDTAITLGNALKEALGEKRGIKRYGERFVPMDESLTLSVIDLSGRIYSKTDIENIKEEKTEGFETILVEHFFNSLAQGILATIHIKNLYGKDPHHIIESIFKSFGRALREACEKDNRIVDDIPSTKGLL